MKQYSARIGAYLLLSTASISCFSAHARIYGLKNAQDFNSKAQGPFYIQLEAFSNEQNAFLYKDKTQPKTRQKINVERRAGHFAVIAGPLYSSAEVRAVSYALSEHVAPVNQSKLTLPAKNQRQEVINSATIDAPITSNPPTILVKPTLSCFGCYFSAGIGKQWNDFDKDITIYNGSAFPKPYDKDRFSLKQNSQTLVAVSGGYRWKRETTWFPSYSLGLQYKHVFAENIGNTITQYSIPEFNNYKYRWTVQSNVVSASTKLNLFNYSRFSPFVSGGLGIAFNKAQGYQEVALPDVTPRISPDFSNHTNNSLAFDAGVGFDYQLSTAFILSLAYQYQDLGEVSSGNGGTTWAGQNLHLRSYTSNGILLSINYLFGNEDEQ